MIESAKSSDQTKSDSGHSSQDSELEPQNFTGRVQSPTYSESSDKISWRGDGHDECRVSLDRERRKHRRELQKLMLENTFLRQKAHSWKSKYFE